jgi:hypothetical protein
MPPNAPGIASIKDLVALTGKAEPFRHGRRHSRNVLPLSAFGRKRTKNLDEVPVKMDNPCTR